MVTIRHVCGRTTSDDANTTPGGTPHSSRSGPLWARCGPTGQSGRLLQQQLGKQPVPPIPTTYALPLRFPYPHGSSRRRARRTIARHLNAAGALALASEWGRSGWAAPGAADGIGLQPLEPLALGVTPLPAVTSFVLVTVPLGPSVTTGRLVHRCIDTVAHALHPHARRPLAAGANGLAVGPSRSARFRWWSRLGCGRCYRLHRCARPGSFR
jgi:hypothetical protein